MKTRDFPTSMEGLTTHNLGDQQQKTGDILNETWKFLGNRVVYS